LPEARVQDVDTDYDGGRRIFLVLAAIFMVVVVGGVIDLILDRPTTLFSVHVAFEVLMVGVSLGAAAYLGKRWYATEAQLVETERASEQLTAERREWEQRAAVLLRGLGEAISAQFDHWSLTETERRVALMLLKGLSHKGIAKKTGTSERTVRQHAVAVYRKSGLAGRAELAGFFLEDLLLPEDTTLEQL
jgi:DNA-binding NarL/FixJ family response regulator